MYEYLNEPDRVTGEISEFIELDTIDLGPVPHYGSSKGTKSRHAQYVERRLLRPLARRNIPGTATVRDRLNEWNHDAPKPSMRPGTRDMLMERYAPDLARLEQLLGVDVVGQERAAARRR
jgi:hypothetical protein